ncbi:hypothetical protein AMELA_G00085730 [Ameiurus melas]|uniref:PDEase domain-containing protein n=1 Tax=Ameiurus melas TaxID=219545 RepID=A0A7J6AXD2_AMEME|nr:hypothetical protein AMELA_G00085730 [Ameiurus melas]
MDVSSTPKPFHNSTASYELYQILSFLYTLCVCLCRSEVAILYNDRSVLENHHVSAAYRLMQDDEMNILINLSKDDWRELRTLVIEMVMSTDMSCHFQQIKTMRNSLQQPEGIDKPKALSLMLHAADISHPAKGWNLHYRWTQALMEEFFLQGDKEAELGLPFSPLCDRKATMIAQSQIGFIDFIVEPTISVLVDTTEKIITPLIEEALKSGGVRRKSLTARGSAAVVESVQRHSERDSVPTDYSLAGIDLKRIQHTLSEIIQRNKERWKELSVQELASKEQEQRSEREDLSRKTDVSLIHSSLDSESKSLSEVNNTDSLHSSQDSLEQSAASHSADPTDASPDATLDASPDVDRPLPWNGKSA